MLTRQKKSNVGNKITKDSGHEKDAGKALKKKLSLKNEISEGMATRGRNFKSNSGNSEEKMPANSKVTHLSENDKTSNNKRSVRSGSSNNSRLISNKTLNNTNSSVSSKNSANLPNTRLLSIEYDGKVLKRLPQSKLKSEISEVRATRGKSSKPKAADDKSKEKIPKSSKVINKNLSENDITPHDKTSLRSKSPKNYRLISNKTLNKSKTSVSCRSSSSLKLESTVSSNKVITSEIKNMKSLGPENNSKIGTSLSSKENAPRNFETSQNKLSNVKSIDKKQSQGSIVESVNLRPLTRGSHDHKKTVVSEICKNLRANITKIDPKSTESNANTDLQTCIITKSGRKFSNKDVKINSSRATRSSANSQSDQNCENNSKMNALGKVENSSFISPQTLTEKRSSRSKYRNALTESQSNKTANGKQLKRTNSDLPKKTDHGTSKKIERLQKKIIDIRKTPTTSRAKGRTSSDHSLLNEKVPVWKKDKIAHSSSFHQKPQRQSKRVSLLKNKDVYEFSFEDDKENIRVKRKKARKYHRYCRKKPKGSTKSSLLTTDPMFESLTKSLFNSNKLKSKGVRQNRLYGTDQERLPGTEPLDNLSSKYLNTADSNYKQKALSSEEIEDHLFDDTDCDDIGVDDAGYEAGISMGNETNSAYQSVKSSYCPTPIIENENCKAYHSVKSSLCPTPMLPSSSFMGVASTPRSEFIDTFNPFKTTSAVEMVTEADVKHCFGFDEPEYGIGLSPVKKSKQLANLHAYSISVPSNVEEIEPMPTRLNIVGFKKPVLISKNTHSKRVKPKKDSLKENQDIKIKKGNRNGNTPSIKGYLHSVRSKNGDSKMQSSVDANRSVLFDIINDENFSPNVSPSKSTTHPLSPNSKTPSKVLHMSSIASPEKSFSKPPKRSYNRESLEAVRKKYRLCDGGYSGTVMDSESEESETDNESVVIPTKRKRRVASNPVEKESPVKKSQPRKKKKVKNYSKENKELADNNKTEKVKKKTKDLEKTIVDWASDINSHFSEIEDIPLVIE